MTVTKYRGLKEAAGKLCGYCENDECDACQVKALMDCAHDEAVEAGIIKED